MTHTPETIDLTPHLPGMFRYAIQLCRDGLSQSAGRDLVISMLEFGARLDAARDQADEEEVKCEPATWTEFDAERRIWITRTDGEVSNWRRNDGNDDRTDRAGDS